MQHTLRFTLAAVLAVTAAAALAQGSTALSVDDLAGAWNLTYEDGQTGTLTFSKNADGSPKIMVSTATGGDSEADQIAFEGDTVSFSRAINVGEQASRVNYTAKLMDGKLEGTGEVVGGGFGGGGPTPYTATRAE